MTGGSQSSEEKLGDSERKIACASTTIQEDVISMCVVPVKVKHKDSNFVYSTFAMLDNCSQGCFVTASLMKTLQIRGWKTSITVKTLTGEENHTMFALEGLRVCNQLGLNQELISLPKAYTKEDLPVDSWEVATAQKLKKWKLLLCVADEVIKDDQNINVELLIGANCTRALEPIKVISSRNDGPYAMKTVLGWCIVGPIFTSVIGETTGDVSYDDQIFLRLITMKSCYH